MFTIIFEIYRSWYFEHTLENGVGMLVALVVLSQIMRQMACLFTYLLVSSSFFFCRSLCRCMFFSLCLVSFWCFVICFYLSLFSPQYLSFRPNSAEKNDEGLTATNSARKEKKIIILQSPLLVYTIYFTQKELLVFWTVTLKQRFPAARPFIYFPFFVFSNLSTVPVTREEILSCQ